MTTLLLRIGAALIGAFVGYRLGLRTAAGTMHTPFVYAWYANAIIGAAIGFCLATIVPFFYRTARPVAWAEQVIQVTTPGQLDEVLVKAGDKPVLVDFYASWCPPCRAMTPNINALAKEGHHVVVVNVDAANELAKKYQISSIPALRIFKQKEIVHREEGYHSVDALRALVK